MEEVILKDGQQRAFNQVVEWLQNGEKRIVLIGSAGVGKTVVASELIKRFRKDRTINPAYNNGLVYATAPTNKALSVLQSKIQTPVEFKTIHSALKLQRFIDRKTGEERFIKPKTTYKFKQQDEFLTARVAVIDECSMLSKSFVGGYADEYGHHKGHLDDIDTPIVFIGDEKQLNPVKEDFSPAFHQGWKTIELTEIIRQGAGNPIIDLSRDLDMIYFKSPNLIKGKGYTYDNDKARIIDDLAEVNGTDELKFLTYTNVDVDSMNLYVRQRRYGNPAKIERLETIVFNSPFGSFFTNQEVKVEDVDIITDYVKIPKYETKFDFQNQPISETDKLKMKYYSINNGIKIIHEDSEQLFKQVSAQIKLNCTKRGWHWAGHYFFAEQFADIKYNHALSIHKSQGSTYKTAIVNIGCVDMNRNMPEKQRMLYTAVTRASDLVVLYNVK